MSSVTLVESMKLAQDDLVSGVIENIITLNQFFQALPFDDIEGNSLKYNRENALGGVGVAGVGDVIGTNDSNPLTGGSGEGKDPATFTEVFSGLTTILGDAEINGMIQATRSADNDQTGTQIGSKAKHTGRVFQHMLINGTGAGDQFDGMINLCASGQTRTTTAANGDVLSLEIVDEVMDLVTAKDGVVDYLTMNVRERRKYRALLRALGGASVMEVVELPGGEEIMGYSQVPIFRNDYIPTNQVHGGSSAVTSTIFAGVFDDGTRQMGLAGLTASAESGIRVKDIGESETKDERIWRVIWYTGLALFSEKGLACGPGITP